MTKRVKCDRLTQSALEFDKLKFLLQCHITSEPGLIKLEQLQPLRDIDQLRHLQKLCSEVKMMTAPLPLTKFIDVSEILQKAKKIGSTLLPEQLVEILTLLDNNRKIRSMISKLNSIDFPKILEELGKLPELSELENSIRNSINLRGEILDHASHSLSSIRQKQISTRRTIQRTLTKLMNSTKFQKSIQEKVITTRNNRYVIPVRREFKSKIGGIIQDQSSSGLTTFIEPFEVVELNNELSELAIRELKEVRKILRKLTELVREKTSELSIALTILSEVDLLNAKAKLSVELNASEPILNENGIIKLMATRHPILETNLKSQSDAHELVPIDLQLGGDFDTIVVTGPNTGGKTVLLKTVGLLTLMASSGMHIPADSGSEIALFDRIFTELGDGQNIEQNLSTFSASMTRVVEMLKVVTPNSLVLMDEVGAGTEPTEACAIGMAILDFLTNYRVKTIITTHHGALKVHAHTQNRMVNASVEFDWETLKPTYALSIGKPGSSNALSIADRLGMPSNILQRAKNYVDRDAGGAVENFIIDLQTSQKSLEADREAIKTQSELAEIERQKYDEMSKKLEIERFRRISEAQLEADRILKNARRTAEETIAEIRRAGASKKSIGMAFEELDRSRDELRKNRHRKISEEHSVEPSEIAIGDTVFVKSLSCDGEIVSIGSRGKKPIMVRVGRMTVQVGVHELGIPKSDKGQGVKRLGTSVRRGNRSERSDKLSKPPLVPTAAFMEPTIGIDLHGCRVYEALERTDKFLDDAFLEEFPAVKIVHGIGTGRLREAIHGLLKKHPLIEDFKTAEQNEGGDGATIATFKS